MGKEEIKQLDFLNLVESRKIDRICAQVFEVVEQRWENHGFEIPTIKNPPNLGTESTHNPDLRISGIGHSLAQVRLPKVKDIDIPQEFAEFIDYYCLLKKRGGTQLPAPWALWKFMAEHPETSESELENRWMMSAYDKYSSWMGEQFGEELFVPTRPTNISITIGDETYPSRYLDYTFSRKQALVRFTRSEPHPAEYARRIFDEYGKKLTTYASFRGNKLYRLWWEVPNGTFFPDPRGDMDEIYPYWLKKPLFDYIPDEDKKPRATKYHWEDYLQRIRNGEPVISGRTLEYVHQTERQAVNNLMAWREYIYYKFPQVFYFRRIPQEPGFVAKQGYTMFGQYGLFVVKNRSYREPNWEQAQERLFDCMTEIEASTMSTVTPELVN